MRLAQLARRLTCLVAAPILIATGCAFHGVNSLPLPGAVGRGPGAVTYHVELTNVGTLESNSPVLLNDVVVGSVGDMDVDDWHADVEVTVRPDIVIPANAVATVGQTSLLGSMHLSLDPPPGVRPEGHLAPGAILGINASKTYPSTEQTLSSLSALVNTGGLGQIGDIVKTFNTALAGHQDELRDLLTRLDRFVGVFDDQRANVIASLRALNRLAGTLKARDDVITTALQRVPAALDVLLRERPHFTTALDKLREFGDTATGLVADSQNDLVGNLQNLAPTVQALADVGPDIGTALAFLPVYPFGQNVIDRGVRGDYMNLFVTVDLTRNRLKRGLLDGTRWGDEDLPLVPAPGDPGYNDYYTNNPLGQPVIPPPPQAPREPVPPGPAGAVPPGAPPLPPGPPTGGGGS
jgi:phospholipid/cholesterol/gamma-HCH transport system substrate-binding protein